MSDTLESAKTSAQPLKEFVENLRFLNPAGLMDKGHPSKSRHVIRRAMQTILAKKSSGDDIELRTNSEKFLEHELVEQRANKEKIS